MLKGYRTLFFGFITILLGLLGKHVAPELIDNYLDVIFAVVGIGIIGLRLITTTPFGQVILHDVGFSDADVVDFSKLAGTLYPSGPPPLELAVSDLNAAVGKLTGHPLLQPATVDVLSQLAESVPNVLSALSSAQAAAEPAKAEPASGEEALRPAPQPPQPTSDPAPALNLAPAAAAQAQQ